MKADRLSRADIERLPHFKQRTRSGEYSAACPFCGAGEDRFRFWRDAGRYWCRVCDAKGFVGDAIRFDPDRYAEWKARQKEERRRAKLSALGRLRESQQHKRYHKNLTDRSFWYRYGLTDRTIDAYKLGYSSICPTFPKSASYTIPIKFRGQLYNIRHRLVEPNGSGKYRPEMAGLPAAMFNADILENGLDWSSEVVIVEGEVKALVLQQQGFGAVAIPGASVFKEKWASFFQGKNVYVAMDPGVEEQAARIWRTLGEAGVRVRLCSFPVKPDDFFVLYGGRSSEFFSFLLAGRRWSK